MTAPVRYLDHPKAKPGDPCSLCGDQDQRPVIDHCHKHGWARGVVCRSCNSLMIHVDKRTHPHGAGPRIGLLLDHVQRCHECPAITMEDLAPAPRPRPLRLSDTEVAEVQTVADRDGLRWSEAARRMLAYAARHMPEGWHLGKEAR